MAGELANEGRFKMKTEIGSHSHQVRLWKMHAVAVNDATSADSCQSFQFRWGVDQIEIGMRENVRPQS